MELYVCVKSVPKSDAIVFDESTGALKREGSDAQLNPSDLVALEAALRCADRFNASVTAVCMGPYSARAALREALSMGVKEAYLLNSPAFAGADVLATSYTLSTFFLSLDSFDIIFCGKHSADGDTGQTGAALAEWLNIPHAGTVCEIETIEDGKIFVKQLQVGYTQHLCLKTPCLLVVENDIFYPRIPSLNDVLRARKHSIKIKTEADINNIDIARCGFKGSATQVKHIYVPQNRRRGQMLRSEEYDCLLPVLKGVKNA